MAGANIFLMIGWMEALQDAGLNKEFYIGRERGANELFPWEHIQPAVARSFLRRI